MLGPRIVGTPKANSFLTYKLYLEEMLPFFDEAEMATPEYLVSEMLGDKRQQEGLFAVLQQDRNSVYSVSGGWWWWCREKCKSIEMESGSVVA